MKKELFFEFEVNKATNTIEITREFNAEKSLVWQAWTQAEILDQWWAPKPFYTETKSLELKVGGRWLYAMVSPQGDKHWCKADYKKVEKEEVLSWLDAFCDENGNENQIKPRSLWNNVFKEKDGLTTVSITLKHDKLEDIEAMISMGFKEGLSMALGNLDELLLVLK
ncbi:MAG: SRPBCC domain-containing protein [Saprospiraceae bacterium]